MARIEDVLSGRLTTHNAPIGTRVSGFVKGESGPFKCGNCIHFSKDACNHPMLMADSQVEKNAHGDAIVDADDCCNYFRNKKGDRNG
jgi:hypothetical protein